VACGLENEMSKIGEAQGQPFVAVGASLIGCPLQHSPCHLRSPSGVPREVAKTQPVGVGRLVA